MRYFLALDAGGTRTECWLADEDRVLAQASAETLKLMSVGAQRARERLTAVLRQVSEAAGVPLGSITRTCIGLAGISSEGVRTWAEITLADLVGGELLVMGDDEIALEAAFDDGPGVLVVAGTGSRVVGRCSNGTRMTAGGWGPMLGDEGSGHWIGLEAIRSGLRARDRGVQSCVLRELMGFWGVDNVGALIGKANQRPRPDFAPLTEVVAACAAQGDVLAASVLERAGQELAALTTVVFSKMQAAGCGVADCRRVAFTGSVLAKISVVRREMREALRQVRPEAELDDAETQPVQGALKRARRG